MTTIADTFSQTFESADHTTTELATDGYDFDTEHVTFPLTEEQSRRISNILPLIGQILETQFVAPAKTEENPVVLSGIPIDYDRKIISMVKPQRTSSLLFKGREVIVELSGGIPVSAEAHDYTKRRDTGAEHPVEFGPIVEEDILALQGLAKTV